MKDSKYIIRDREAGNIIDEFKTKRDAEKALKRYEKEDMANDCYEPYFYEIVAA